MLLQRLDFLLPYTVKCLTSADVDEILALQAKHLEYHQHYQTDQVTKEDILAELETLPPKALPEQKFYLGFYVKDELVVLVDLVLDHPKANCAWLGLVMTEKTKLRQHYATRVLTALRAALKREGYKELMTSSALSDVNAQAFLNAQGFEQGMVTWVYDPKLGRDIQVILRGLEL